MAMEEKVRDILTQYLSDEVMLDAFFQWATNPTSMSAGYGLEENYPYIKKNLMNRYGISPTEADKRVSELRTKCDALINEANILPLKEREKIGEVQRTLCNVLSQGDYKIVRRQGVSWRLRAVSEETRKALLLFNLLENIKASLSVINFGIVYLTNP